MYDIRFLDELAANARPARIQQSLEGWRLRAADGITRRANSVLTNAPMPSFSDWFEMVEDFYRRHGLPGRYQISPASPPELDALLESRGYRSVSNTSVMVGTVQGVLERVESLPAFAVSIDERVSEDWVDKFLAAEGYPDEQGPLYLQSFSAMGPRAAFGVAREGAKAVGVGICVAERGWAGLFSIVTLMDYRRRGIGREIVRSLLVWARGMGAEQVYLQVVAGNAPAVSLYVQLGFVPLYSYHYRENVLG